MTYLPDVKTHYKALVIERAWYWNNDGETDVWNGVETCSLTQVTLKIQGKDEPFDKIGL